MNRNPLNLDFREPGRHCNARTPKGYCGNRSGYKTAHVGDGRCYLHGGNLPSKGNSFQSIYTKMLPTNLAIELAEIKHDPMFATLFNEFALLRLITQGLLRDLPADLSSMYGRMTCDTCKCDLEKYTDTFWIKFDDKFFGDEQKRLKELVSTVEVMSRVFEKMSKNEERQKRFIKISEIEQLMVQWGKIIMKHLGDDPRLPIIQEELMQCGFMRNPGDQDEERLNKFRDIQSKANNAYTNKKKSMAQAMNEAFAEEVDYEIIPDNKNNGGYKWTKPINEKRRVVNHDGIFNENNE